MKKTGSFRRSGCAGRSDARRWEVVIGGDVGGFGAGSEFSWSAIGTIGYNFNIGSVESSIFAGYKAIADDFDADNFTFDATLHGHLDQLDKFIGDLDLGSVHMGTLQPFIEARRRDGVKAKTINLGLGVVRHILNVAASEWVDDHGLTWLAAAPKIKLLKTSDGRKPYPLSADEQERLFAELPEHLRKMALLKVNTGCRDAEVCGLRWEWEIEVPELETSVFVIPGDRVKNGADRLVVLNSVARSIIGEQRGLHPEYVFVYSQIRKAGKEPQFRPIETMNNTSWQKARRRANLPKVRVHDLKHTFGRRLRAAGVSFEDRQDLLGHKSARMTTHYSAPELSNLIEAAEKACRLGSRKSPAVVALKQKAAAAQAATA